MAAELLDLAEKSVELQRVLADNAALQKQSVRRAGAVPDFPQAIHSLVGIETNDGQGLGPGFTTVATRMSVIFSVEGAEFVFTVLG